MLSATQLADLTRCNHRVFLDANGDATERLPASPERQRVWQEGREHEARIVEGLAITRIAGATYEERIAGTVALMRTGADLIYHALLASGDLVGEPDLLKRVDHTTVLGNFGYVPVDVKNGRATKSTESGTTKPAYAVQLGAYAELLEGVQGWRPSEGFIVDQHGVWQPVDLAGAATLYQDVRSRFEAVRDGREETIPGWNNECPECAWKEHCLRVMTERDDLTLMPGIGIPKREKLFAIGIRTRADLASAAPENLAAVKGLGKQALLWPLRARAMRTGEPVLREPWMAPDVEYEFSYDVENTPGFVYLHGLLLRKTGGQHFGEPTFADADFGTFDPVCAVHPETEEEVWRTFLDKLDDWTSRGSFVVYIYSPVERRFLRQLKSAYGGSSALDRFEAQIVDLWQVVKRCVVLPTGGDGLKAVATHIGFHWRDATPGGAQSMTWWGEYWKDPVANAVQRDRVLVYNEDDVRATLAIRDWLTTVSGGGATIRNP